MLRTRLSILGLALIVGCGASTQQHAHDLSGRSVATPTLMVSRPIERKLYLVMDPVQVPDTVVIRRSNHSATAFRSFLTRSLRAALGHYFQGIAVVESAPTTAEPHIIADVRLDSVEMGTSATPGKSALKMQWALALRPSEVEDYVFSFAGQGVSEAMDFERMVTFERAFEQMLLSALTGFIEKWTSEDVFPSLRAVIRRIEEEATPTANPEIRQL
ncbi:MAG: hypothetical protein JJ863_24935 [Deltaproteobacteria bacterium]|nr:hypothetical protein [Deltaproteobacteria bacterium]